MPFGFHRKILHVDLTKGVFRVEEPEEAFYRKYMGGSALGLFYVLTKTPPRSDPFGPENTLVLALSVLTGVPVSGQSRMTAVAKSPLTGAIGDSQCGGFWPAEMKFSGFDAAVITGRSARPVYLWLHDNSAELRDASRLWGKETGEVETIIRQKLGDSRVQVLQCGPAGEKKVRYASLINMCSRANGRTGLGAVLASKNLRAVAVRGRARPVVADELKVRELAQWGVRNVDNSGVAGLALLGTSEVIPYQNQTGGLPTRNYSSGVYDGFEAISGQRMNETLVKKRTSCFGCAVRCKREVEVKNGPFVVDSRFGAPEYETIATFGSYCCVDDLKAIAKANEICNRYGVDTISCGATIAWAMECFEAGIINERDTGGIRLSFGNALAMVKMTEMIARREGFGDLLAEGSARAAEFIGRGSRDYLVTIKRKEIPAHMPQVKRSLALIYAVCPFGPDHQSSEHDESYDPDLGFLERLADLGLVNPRPPHVLDEEKVLFAFKTQCLYSALDCLNLCQFVFGPSWQLYGPSQIVEFVSAVTGWDVSLRELIQVGERRINMMRMFNVREGFGRDDDRLPEKFFRPLKGGITDGATLDGDQFRSAREAYYEMAGWDKVTGVPTPKKLEELDLEWAVPEDRNPG
ncbi:MAG: aldehyde ferredoxin oxidoreductase family protein [Candidatus Aminicenantes bacterium]|nr:aldehyde ferredoxin oxidoreductase family protein [Candidatus Aminicenantes bacterium]